MWTNDQLKAIEAPVSDILVTAAAGSGKTAVMVERLISRIIAEDGTDIDKILVVTFTKAAASEIKERISSKIASKLAEGDNPRLKNQLVLINRASICTIHSYCLDILRNNFHLLGLDPNFKVGDATEINILRARALGDVLDRHYDLEDGDFLRVINSFTNKRDDAIEDIIADIYNFSQSAPNPGEFLDMCAKSYSDGYDDKLSYILDISAESAEYAVQCYRRALILCGSDAAFEKPAAVISDEMTFAENICKLCKKGVWDDVYSYISQYKFSVMRSNKNMDANAYEEIKLLRDNGRNALKDIMANKVNLPVETIEEDLSYMYPCVEKLCELVREFSEAFARYKRDRNIVDFNDIEHLALELLTNPQYSEVAKSQRARFDEIYVDEYQDCNGVQEALFKAVSRESEGAPNMFMVGDMKQCIYRFRNANPLLFKNKSDTYLPYGEGGDYSKIALSKNFRSRGEVLNGINLVFSRIMSESVGELTYSEEEYLYNGAVYEAENEDTQYIDICIIDSADDDDGDKIPSVEAEAALVADRIYNMVKEGYVIFDKSQNKYRPLKYRDIAILLRGVQGSGDYFSEALSGKGIPSFCDSDASYFNCEEVNTLISFIKIISNPLDDINLVSVMRSPIYNFTDSQLLSIRSADKTGYFYEAVEKYSNGTDGVAFKTKAFIKDMDEYRLNASVMAVDEFLWHLINKTGYMEFVSTLPNSSVKKTNIRTLISKARAYSQNSGGDISGFASYVDEITASGDGRGAKLIGENDDVVRIMTIHKSKGLEFPVVFLSQCGKKFNMRDLSEKVLLHHELGMGIDYVDTEKRFSYKLVTKNAIRAKIAEENISEEVRLLYVAMTRAREKLFITGVVKDYSKFMADIHSECGEEGRLHPRVVASSGTYLKWICQAIYEADGGLIRKVPGGGAFKKEIIPIGDMGADAKSDYTAERDLPTEWDSAYKNEINRRLAFEYPYGKHSMLPRNVTVTEIKRIGEMAEEATYRLYRMPQLKKPAFASEGEKIGSAERGTLMHLCMEKLRLTDGINHDTIKEEINALVTGGIITPEQAEAVDTRAIASFFEGDVGKQMVESSCVHREVPFEILVEADEIFKTADTSEKIVVQGMIDAYFTDKEGNTVLVDYKTDRCKLSSADEFKRQVAERYQLQIYYYEKALTLMTGKIVGKKYIYLFDIGEAVEII